jgi:hypothetical protein
MKIRPVGATLFPADMDAHDEAVYFRNSSANAPKEETFLGALMTNLKNCNRTAKDVLLTHNEVV